MTGPTTVGDHRDDSASTLTPLPGTLAAVDPPPPAVVVASPIQRPTPLRLALLCVGSVAAATLASRALWSWLSPSVSLFLVSVVLCAWYGGLVAGLVTSVLATVAADLFLLGGFQDAADALRAVVRALALAGSAWLIGYLASRRRAAEAEIRRANLDLEQRVAERTQRLRRVVESLGIEVEARARAERAAVERQERLRAMAAEVAGAEERERRRVASGLHDEVAQLLSVALSRMKSLAASSMGRNHLDDCMAVMDALSKALATVRTLTFEIAPPVLYELGLRAAGAWLVARTREDQRIAATFAYAGGEARAPEAVEVAVFQSLRELLRNAVRHGQAKHVAVALEIEDRRLSLEVADDGRGFDPARAARGDGGGWGLFSIEERMRLVEGTLALDSAPGRGTRATITVALDRARDARPPRVPRA